MPELGRAALVVCFLLALYAVVAGFWGAHARRRRLSQSAKNALIAAFGSAVVASAVLLVALGRSDFRFSYVSAHTSRELPTAYKLASFYGGQEGSLLLWLVVLTGYGAAAVLLDRKAGRELVAWVVPVLGVVAAFFAMLDTFVASPFHTQLAPAQGSGLDPSLQNPYMLAHPPLLYLGYVGLTVPFAFAMGALLSRRTDERWIVATRRWTLLAWAFLGIGQLLGAKWAYEEVGWGGYYAWDPVENAALMPWLAATAFLHSVMVQERKGMLKVWNMLLVILAFSLSLFGTFLTCSGVLNSIHSFTEGSIGPWFLGFICFVVAFSLALLFYRLPLLRSKTKLESLVSREATFLYNNLLLVALCLTILWGVTFPILSEAVKGEAVTVGRPYYDFFLRAFGLPLLLLMGIGPLIAWRRASLRSLGRTFLWPFAAALVAGAGLIVAGAGSSIPGLIAYTFAAFIAATIALEFIRGTQARRALSNESAPRAFGELIARNRRRYGGYIVHAAILMLAIGIAGSSAYDTSHSARLAPGDSMKLRNYTLVYRGLNSQRSQNALETRAAIDVYRGGDRIATMHPGKNNYPVEQQISNEVSIRSDWLTGEDLFLITEQVNQNGSIDFKAIINPLVNLLWAAGLVFLLGSAIALWPDAREERRLAVRYGRLPREAWVLTAALVLG